MVYTTDYQSPLGTIFLAADEKGLTGLWLEGQKYYAAQIKKEECRQEEAPVLKETKRWLDIYFQGKEPDFMFRRRERHCRKNRKRFQKYALLILL